jgi:hypothetical protein
MIGGRVPDRGCQRKFYEPIPLPGGRQIVTLEDAGDYIANLSKTNPHCRNGKPPSKR